MRDPYLILGIKREASEAEIKKAYRKLAKMYHPDRKSENPNAKDRFNDAKKRAQFDCGEIDSEGKPRFQGFGGFGAGHPGAGHPGDVRAGARGANAQHFEFDIGGGPFGGRGGIDPSDIFSHLFGNQSRTHQAGASRTQKPAKGEDIKAEMTLSLMEAASGTTKRVRAGAGREVEVKVPPGVEDGKVMRLRGLGSPGLQGAESGDILLTFRVRPDERFTIQGHNLHARVPVDIKTAVLGGAVRVPTLTGEAEMTIPAMTSGTKLFRLRGKGLGAQGSRGDLLVAIDIILPERDDDLTALMHQHRHEKAPGGQ